jgi:serine/threonine protein kinase
MPIDFQLVQSVFQALAALPPAERPAVLERECAGDAELRRCVEALLQAHDDSGELPAANLEWTRAYDPPVELGQLFAGRYKLREKLGEGGMGVVFVADQTEPVQRRVALKIIRAGLDTHRLLARFEQERQALALMDHPNIAKVFDAGIADLPSPLGGEGPGVRSTPYFAMELVKGLPLTRYCDDARLSPRQRLELFIPVCQAVQHAHQKGIIHRDLKPSNILVGLYDGRPVPKVIDFGVAKATGPRLTEHSVYTEVGSMIGTLEYMSPEQAELNNLDIDTRSDVYALGVILYQLLTGAVPFSRKELEQAGLAEMLRVIKEMEPAKPSTKLSQSGTLPRIAAQRQTEPKKLTALVRGELDWIVMKALEKDRGRRYETANGFALDVQRYLAGEAVLAAPASRWYRLRKFGRKHRKALVTAGAFLVLLGAAAVVSTWQAIRAVQAETAANASAEQARRNAAEAERNARQARDEASARAVALKAEQQARSDETKARQQAFAALRSMTDDVVERKFAQGAVLTEEDRAFLRGVIAQYDAFAAIKGDDADSRAVRAEGRLRVGNMRFRLGELKEAEQDYDQALSIYKQLVTELPNQPDYRQGLAISHNNRGNLLRDTGRPKEAEQDFDQALSIYKELAADFPNRPEFRQGLAMSYNGRGLLLRATGRLQEAEQDYDQALRIRKRLVADFPNRPEFRHALAASHNNRGLLLSATGRPKEAEKDYGQALSIQKRLADQFPARPEFRQDLAGSHHNRGILLRDTGRPKEAEKDFDQAVSICRQLAADFPSRPEFRHALAASHNNRGILLRDTSRLQQAEQDYDQALRIGKQLAAEFPSRPEFRQDLAGSHNNRGILLRATGRLQEAEKDYDQAVSIFKQLDADFPKRPEFRQDLARSHNSRGNLLRDTGRPKEAEKDYDQAVSISKQLVTEFPNQPDYRQGLAISHNNRGILLLATRRLKEAEQDFDQALSIRKQLVADFPKQPDLRNAVAGNCVNLALLHAQQGNWAAARRLLLEGRPHHLAALKANSRHPDYRQFYRNHLMVLTRVHAELLEQEDAVRTAETHRDLGWNPPADAYDAACFLSRCVPIVAKHDKLDARQRQAAAQFYGDAAMKLLREAVSKGYQDVPHMKKDTDLDPLRQREDFKKLLAELEAKKE